HLTFAPPSQRLRLTRQTLTFLPAVSVSVAVWTLVAISLERYFAICRPLSSRRWQTQFHAYKMIGLVWTVSFLANSPLGYVQRLQPVGRNTGQMKCREEWPNPVWEKAYVLFHDVGLLFLPLLTMGFAYSMIVSKLWRGLRHEIKHSSLYQQTSRPHGQGTVGVGSATVVTGGAAAGSTEHGAGDGGKQQKPVGVKRHEPGFVLTSSLKKGPFKATTAVVNFASNNNTISKGNSFNGGGAASGAGSCSASNGAGSGGSSNGSNAGGSNSAGGDQRTLYCGGAGCDTRTGRQRGFRHFFAKLLPGAASNLQPGGVAGVGTGTGPGAAQTATVVGPGECEPSALKQDASYQFSRHAIRSTYMDKSIEAKKKVIRMLFVIIVEFFVCWAPLHILNTVYLYSPTFVYQYVNSSGIALVQLMAYISSCCNPITYCFMNRRFRQAFLGIFSCYRNRMPLCCCFCCASSSSGGPMDGAESKTAAYLRQNTINQSGAERNNSDMSGNDSLVYVGRGLVQRSGKFAVASSVQPATRARLLEGGYKGEKVEEER
uniref:G-protein coupled receptors family 1 profile domain-containing protein n=1 Tax=Anopheles epiroticus TaxID=199890 RepID=A0A182PI31_9DIPT